MINTTHCGLKLSNPCFPPLQEAAGVSQIPPTMQLICIYADNLMIQLSTHHCAPPVALHSEVGTEEQICDSEEQ